MVVEASRLHRVKNRRETGLALLEGQRLVKDAVAAGATLTRIFFTNGDTETPVWAAEAGVEAIPVDLRALGRLSGTETPKGPIAVVEIPEPPSDPDSDVLVAWAVSDPGNVGTLIRTAAAFQWTFAYAPGTADPWSSKCLRAGAAGHFQTRVLPIESLSDLGDRLVVASVVEGGQAPTPSEGRVALLIGEEASGLPANVVERADMSTTIPTPGSTESLNAAVAAGILVSEFSKAPKHRADHV